MLFQFNQIIGEKMIYFQHAFFLLCVFNLEAMSGPGILCIV